MNKIKMIVGLSNPKIEYHHTRHNAGSWYIYHIAKYFGKVLQNKKKFFGFTTSFYTESNCIRLLVPNIFMNINGISVFKIASFYNIHLNEILIVHDDLEIEPGFSKIKYSYGHNGHNGLRSIISSFDNKKNFYRFRIGIGRPKNKDEVASFVLSIPPRIEKTLITKSISCAVEQTLKLIT